MKLLSLSIKNFRSVQTLEWNPGAGFVCLLGNGDVGKSTILDAIEAVLSPRRTSIFDTDFLNCDVARSIEIIATVGQLPQEGFDESRFGMHLRSISSSGVLSDEPANGEEPVVTVRLSVDRDLDPKWELINDRMPPKALYSRDRALFGLVRLGSETDSHLTWGQYSHLARLSEQRGAASGALTKAFRQAKQTVKKEPLNELNATAKQVRTESMRLGAYSTSEFEAGLDTQRLLSSLSGLTLHSVDIPLRMAGLGSRRLTALAIERLSVADGAIVLIDEMEHGLEPHRIRHVLKVLKDEHGPDSAGQVIMTTHSPTTLVELSTADLGVVVRASGKLSVKTPSRDLQALVRRDPEAFLSRRIVVCEGKTEMGVARALRDVWADRHDGEPLAYRGTNLADGSGSSGPATAMDFADLGYATCLFRDSDVALTASQRSELSDKGVHLIEWTDAMGTETRVFTDVTAAGVQALLDLACELHGEQAIVDGVSRKVGKALQGMDFAGWQTQGLTEQQLRASIAKAAETQQLSKKRIGWFKSLSDGQRIGQVVAAELSTGLDAPITRTLGQLEHWAYGR